jgi:ATP-dependent DNA helicase PIF1
MDLSEEQQISFNKYIERKNIFITGPGGTGKSTLIKQIQQDAERKGRKIQVCALTGCAAVLLQCRAKTIHSWSGIGLGNGEILFYVQKILKNYYKKKVWKQVDILIIDEVSMMSQKLFDMLDAIGKAVRKNNKPFGGIQVIFLGDFYQLPPIGDRDDPETMKFCFESDQWYETFEKENTVQLKKIFRQTDKIYTKILNQIREGRLSRSSYDILTSLVGRKVASDVTVQPTKLYPTRNSVDSINKTKMTELKTSGYE